MKAQYRCHGTYYGNDAVTTRYRYGANVPGRRWHPGGPALGHETAPGGQRGAQSRRRRMYSSAWAILLEPGSWPVIRGRHRGWRARAPCTSSILRDQRRPSRPPRRARRRHGIIGRSALVRVGSKERGEERDEQQGKGGDTGDRRVLHDPLLLAVDLHGRLDRLRAGGPGQNMAVREVG